MHRGIVDLLSTLSNIDTAFLFLSHLMLIVFPLLRNDLPCELIGVREDVVLELV